MAFQDQGGHRGPQERQGGMVPEVILAMLAQEESLDLQDQRETRGDPASAILDQEDHQATEEIRVTVDLGAAEETVVKRVSLVAKESQERLVSQDLQVNLD